MNTRGEGTIGEQLVCEYMKGRGMRVLQRNFLCRGGEADIIARDGAYLVFTEVKSRNSNEYGVGAEAVTRTKRRRLVHTARCFLAMKGLADVDVRFDVAVVTRGEVEYIEGAFDMNDI